MIQVKNLSYKKGQKEILKDMNLHIPKNKITGILGSNASGKTTLLKHLAREIEVKNHIFLEGIPIENISRKYFAKKISFVAQNVSPLEEILIEDFVKMGRYPYKRKFWGYTREDIEIVKNSLKIFHLEDLGGKPISQTSGGEMKRAFLARSFAQQTEVIILDEPMNHLDIRHQLELMKLLKDMKEKTIVCSIHDIALAMAFCDEIILLKDGRVIDSGKTEEVLTEQKIYEVFEVKNYIERIRNKNVVLYYD